MRYPRAETPTLARQAARLRAAQPHSKLRFDQAGNRLLWIGHLQPTALSDRYRVRIDVRRSGRMIPDVYVESPKLQDRHDETVPHLYDRKRAMLCLWRPGRGEWSAHMWIVDSVLLWASEWLFFYEVWFATGEWLGGGEHPPSDRNAARIRRMRPRPGVPAPASSTR